MFKAIRGARHSRPFAPWRIVVWVVMLLAAMGFVINGFTAVLSAHALGATNGEPPPAGAPDPRWLLLWSLTYTLAAFVVIAIALGTLRWREWGRRALRIVAIALVVWCAWTAWMSYGGWQAIGAQLAQPGLPDDVVARLTKERSILMVGLWLKAMSVPVLGWLAWALGSVGVRQQFATPAL